VNRVDVRHITFTFRIVFPRSETALREALEANGQRFTEQRAAVYRSLCGATDHPTADEVFTTVRSEIADISLATVYKALETLVSCSLAVKLTNGDGSARYDPRTDDHFHLRCLRCGIVRDVDNTDVSGALPTIHPGDGFRVEGYRLEVVGFCANCA
jgi:Fe2+ or Zn2+ uptake regulation protein